MYIIQDINQNLEHDFHVPPEYEYVASGKVDPDFNKEEPWACSAPSAYLHRDIFETDLDFVEYHVDHNTVHYSEESAVDVFDVKMDYHQQDMIQYYMPPDEEDGTISNGGFCSC
jgi:hypothetical protein